MFELRIASEIYFYPTSYIIVLLVQYVFLPCFLGFALNWPLMPLLFCHEYPK
jgi:hypothetical protein